MSGTPSRYQLQEQDGRLVLYDTADPQTGPIRVDFAAGSVQHRYRFGGGRGQAIARAVGLNKRTTLTVVDGTAGLGREAFVLASLGCEVTLLERNPLIHALLADGLQQAARVADPELAAIIARMQLVHADTGHWLDTLDPAGWPDVVYLDPMFPQRRKTARVQKEMRFFQQLARPDPEGEAVLLASARHHCRYRTVVKRPAQAPALAGCQPAFVIPGRIIRYDVYLPD
ncbi:MAG: class I SAM-dependent methyltransferase [Thiothrix sp.]|nr:class I SAM-dependent methyltransferase [Thiothrix sp.]HPQ95464.1 class I SAM-dependent methyltransferase [Thiolinea sp.]